MNPYDKIVLDIVDTVCSRIDGDATSDSMESQKFENENDLAASGEVLIEIPIGTDISDEIADLTQSLESKGWTVDMRFYNPSFESTMLHQDILMLDPGKKEITGEGADLIDQNMVVNGVYVGDVLQELQRPKRVQIVRPIDPLGNVSRSDALYLLSHQDESDILEFLRENGHRVATSEDELHEMLKA